MNESQLVVGIALLAIIGASFTAGFIAGTLVYQLHTLRRRFTVPPAKPRKADVVKEIDPVTPP